MPLREARLPSKWLLATQFSVCSLFGAPLIADPHIVLQTGYFCSNYNSSVTLQVSLDYLNQVYERFYGDSNVSFVGILVAAVTDLKLQIELEFIAENVAGPWPASWLPAPGRVFPGLLVRKRNKHGGVPEWVFLSRRNGQSTW